MCLHACPLTYLVLCVYIMVMWMKEDDVRSTQTANYTVSMTQPNPNWEMMNKMYTQQKHRNLTWPSALVSPNNKMLEMILGYRSVKLRKSQISPVHSTPKRIVIHNRKIGKRGSTCSQPTPDMPITVLSHLFKHSHLHNFIFHWEIRRNNRPK